MKKLFVVALAFVGLTQAANAQTGSILLYGNVGFTSNTNGGSSLLNSTTQKGNFSINPGVGYQLNDKFTVGVEGSYDYADDPSNNGITKSYSAGAFLRHTCPLGGIFSFYSQLGLGWQGESENDGVSSGKGNGFYANVTPAIYAGIKNGFGLNFSIGGLGYSSIKATGSGSTTGSTFGLTFGKVVNIGVSKNFGGGSKKK